MNVEELEGAALDAAVAKAAGIKVSMWGDKPCIDGGGGMHGSDVTAWEPSTNWSQGGPIIQRERIAIAWAPEAYRRAGITGPSSGWEASIAAPTDECKDWRLFAYGETPLVAAMRAFVASRTENGAVQPK